MDGRRVQLDPTYTSLFVKNQYTEQQLYYFPWSVLTSMKIIAPRGNKHAELVLKTNSSMRIHFYSRSVDIFNSFVSLVQRKVSLKKEHWAKQMLHRSSKKYYIEFDFNKIPQEYQPQPVDYAAVEVEFANMPASPAAVKSKPRPPTPPVRCPSLTRLSTPKWKWYWFSFESQLRPYNSDHEGASFHFG